MSRILIIDDNEALIRLLQRVLVDVGHAVQTASTGEAGLELYRREPADVVITDIVMPDMEGLEVIRALLGHDGNAKIIAMSGGGKGSAESYLALALQFGARWFLQKPFTREEILSTVEKATG